MAKLEHDPPLAGDAIDLDRVIVDPHYRRRVIERLRAEAATRAQLPSEPPRVAGHDD